MKSDFHLRLKQAIEDRGISASDLSRMSGVGKSDISYYLKGKYLPKQDKCYLLANALGVDPGWLMTGVEQQEPERTIVIPDTELFRKIIIGMTPDDYRTVMGILEKTEERMRSEGKL